MALGKFNIKIGDEGVDVVVSLYLQAEGRREGQLFRLHSVNVHFLQPRGERSQRLTPSAMLRPSSLAREERITHYFGVTTTLPATPFIFSKLEDAWRMVRVKLNLNLSRMEPGRYMCWGRRPEGLKAETRVNQETTGHQSKLA